MAEDRKIKFLKAELTEADEIINKLETNYKIEKQKSDELIKKCTEYCSRIDKLNQTVSYIENCYSEKNDEIKNLKELLNDASVENKIIKNDIQLIEETKKRLKIKAQELEKEISQINIKLEEKIKENTVLEKNYLELNNKITDTSSSEHLVEISLFDEINDNMLKEEIKNLKEINFVNRKHIIFMRCLNVSYISIIIYLLVQYYNLHF